MSLSLTNVASPGLKSADNELLMTSVLPPEGTPTPQSEQATPTDSAPPFILPRAKLSEDIATDAKPAAAPLVTSPRSSDSFESKLAPALVSESELIQPVKKPYINKKNPDFKLANIMRDSFETTETKDVRKSVEAEAKDLSEASKVPLKSKLWMIFCSMLILLYC